MVDLGSIIVRLTGLWYLARYPSSASVLRERARRDARCEGRTREIVPVAVLSRRFAPRVRSPRDEV